MLATPPAAEAIPLQYLYSTLFCFVLDHWLCAVSAAGVQPTAQIQQSQVLLNYVCGYKSLLGRLC